MDYIAEHRGEFGVEPICRVLTEHGCPIAPSTFYQAVSRRPSRRQLRDEQLTAVIAAERAGSRHVAGLGARKMWLRLRSQGHDVARCTVERLMGQMGVTGLTRGARPPRTCWARIHDRRGDLLLLAAAWGCQAAIWYSCVSPPRTCFRRIRCSARLISGGRV